MLYLNGKIISETEARIDPQDRGFLLGDGVFETMACYQQVPFAFTEHWQRLIEATSFLKLPLPFSKNECHEIITRLLNVNHLSEDAGSRITLTRGIGPRGIVPPSAPTVTTLITVFPVQRNRVPSRVTVSDIRINEYSPLTRFKSLNYLHFILARQAAMQHGFDDASLLNTQGRVASGTAANVFFIKDNILSTPSLNEGRS